MVVTRWFGVAEPLLFLVCERRSCFLVLSIRNLFLKTAKKSQKWTWQGNRSQCCCLFKALDASWPLYQWCPELHLLNALGCDSLVQSPSCLAGTPSCTLFLLMPKAWTRWSTCWQTWRCSPGYQVWEHNICLKTESQSRTLSGLESTSAHACQETSEFSCIQWVLCVVVVISCFLSYYRWRNWNDSDGHTVWAGRLEYETWSRASPHRNDPCGKTPKSPCCYV